MPIPPNPVHQLIDRVWRLTKLLEGDDEEECSLIQRLEQIELQQMDLINSQQRLENLLNLIIKLLSKDGTSKAPTSGKEGQA